MKNTKIAILSTLLAGSLFLQGCTDLEQGVAVGAVIGAAIGAAASSDHNHSPRRCHGGYYTQCNSFRDYYGNYRRECREVYDSCYRTYTKKVDLGLALEGIEGLEVGPAPISSQDMSIANGLAVSVEGVQKLNQSVETLKSGDTSGLQPLGLSTGDMIAVMKSGRLSSQSLENLSRSLNLSPDSTQNLVTRIAHEAKLQVSDIKSSYWKSCMSSGKWSTPENTYCSKTFWDGCSPDTGASLCLAK